MIKAVVFDWGGVLIDNPSNDLMKYCAETLNVETEAFKNIFAKYESIFQKGKISENKLWNKICNELNAEKPLTNSLWKDAVKSVIKDKTEVFRLIQVLKKERYKIGFLSNTEIPAMEYFLENKYEKYFDSTTFSCIENTVKPEEKIYYLALKKLNIKPHECIFVDDKIENIKGANQIGIKGILFENFEKFVKKLAEYSINIGIDNKNSLLGAKKN